MCFRLSVLVRGAPALSVAEFAKAPRRTILGTVDGRRTDGQFFPVRLINLGANRWAFKPEFAVSHPMGQKWLLDVYAGLWLFTANDSFYPGASLRTQAPRVLPGARELQRHSQDVGGLRRNVLRRR